MISAHLLLMYSGTKLLFSYRISKLEELLSHKIVPVISGKLNLPLLLSSLVRPKAVLKERDFNALFSNSW